MFDFFSEANMKVDRNVYSLFLAFVCVSLKLWFLFIWDTQGEKVLSGFVLTKAG